MIAFIDEHRNQYGVEPICKVLPIAPSTYYRCRRLRLNPELRSQRAKRDEQLSEDIKLLWKAHHEVYGARKVWRQLLRESVVVARCTVERLMHQMGLKGAIRGRARKKTTVPRAELERPEDLVQRHFKAEGPNRLWVADLTYVATWTGFVYVAFIIDCFSRKVVGWRVSSSLRSDLALDALEQALHSRGEVEGLIHHSDRGSQYLCVRYSERLMQAGIEGSVGSVGDSYDNALAESVNGLFKTEVIRKSGPWRGLEDVEFATLKWVDWFNAERLHSSLGYVSPVEYEVNFKRSQEAQNKAA